MQYAPPYFHSFGVGRSVPTVRQHSSMAARETLPVAALAGPG